MSKEINQIRPWVRYFARITDYWIYGVLIFILLPFSLFEDVDEYFMGFIIMVVGIFIGAIFLTIIGTTPGKWLFGTSVKSEKKQNLLFGRALMREVKVFVYGFGLGIPLVSLFTLINAYSKLDEKNKTSWDKEQKAVTIHKKIGWKVFLIILLWIIFLSLFIIGETI
jgi:hypothetical protein